MKKTLGWMTKDEIEVTLAALQELAASGVVTLTGKGGAVETLKGMKNAD